MRTHHIASRQHRELQPCGTLGAAKRHRRAGQPLCEPCREAERAYEREYDRTRPPRYDIDEMAVERAVAGDPPTQLTIAEREEAVRRLHALNYSDRGIARRLGIAERTAHRIRHDRLGLPAVPALYRCAA